MTQKNNFESRNDYLNRLPPESYRGEAVVHWSMTIEDRRTGWLTPIFYYKFRENLTHSMFRYGLCCPIYCCMTDHIHLLWMGLFAGSDQLIAAKHFRKHLNEILQKLEIQLQRQGHDHVLKEEERERSVLEDVVEYIARNPERAGLVPPDGFREYPYTGCLVPGHPDLVLWQPDSWVRFWRTCSYIKRNGLMQLRSTGES